MVCLYSETPFMDHPAKHILVSGSMRSPKSKPLESHASNISSESSSTKLLPPPTNIPYDGNQPSQDRERRSSSWNPTSSRAPPIIFLPSPSYSSVSLSATIAAFLAESPRARDEPTSVYVTYQPKGSYGDENPLILLFEDAIPEKEIYFAISEDTDENDALICTICQEEIRDQAIVMKAGCCGAYFHQRDLSTWVFTEFCKEKSRPSNCPACMRPLGSSIPDERMSPSYRRIVEMNPPDPLFDFELPEL